MNIVGLQDSTKLSQPALQFFFEMLRKIDPELAVRDSVKVQDTKLFIFEKTFELADFSGIYVISIGKAAVAMAVGLNEILVDKISGAVISAPKQTKNLPDSWQIFTGGHPIPNEDSLAAAQAAIDLLKRANHEKALVIFLISGGGSAMLDLLKDEKISLEDLRQGNKILVECGAPIGKVNTIRRCLSQIKGGGLSDFAPSATKISLIISDTNPGDEANVASGPTIQPLMNGNSPSDVGLIVEQYNLRKLLPKAISEALDKYSNSILIKPGNAVENTYFTLLSNQTAIQALAESAENSGFLTEISNDLIETPIVEGCRELAIRLFKLREKAEGKPVAIISGGEFACRVQGAGIGGRNQESTLRCLLEIEKLKTGRFDFAILNAGTDGIDGNSPAAGAFATETTLERARILGLDPNEYLANSDSYTFFKSLGETIEIGATGTNVRDVRILLAL